MRMYQIAIAGCKPTGGYWLTSAAAQREIGFLMADDRRHAAEAMAEAGIVVPATQYVVVPVLVDEPCAGE